MLAGAALTALVPGTAWAGQTWTAPTVLALPPPTGPYRVGTTAAHLVDTTRREPLAPDDRPHDLSDFTVFKSTIDLGSVVELGTIDGLRAETITRAYVRAWLDRYLRGRPSPLLVREPGRFPEVDFQP